MRLIALALVVFGVLLLALPGRDAPPAPPEAPERGERAPERPERSERRLRPARCPAEADNCAAVTGRVIYVEAVDPDGDGDAHYVLAGGNVTGPGLSVVDVPVALRPRRLPGAGDLVTAAGPVYTGSYGQKQIEAVEVRHRRR